MRTIYLSHLIRQIDHYDPISACRMYNALKAAQQAVVVDSLFTHRHHLPSQFEISLNPCFTDGLKYDGNPDDCSLYHHAPVGNSLFTAMRLISSLTPLAQSELLETWNEVNPKALSEYIHKYHYAFDVMVTLPEPILRPVIEVMEPVMREGLSTILSESQRERLDHCFDKRIKRIRPAANDCSDEDHIIRVAFICDVLKAHEAGKISLPGLGERIAPFYYHKTMPKEWQQQLKGLAKAILPFHALVIDSFKNKSDPDMVALTLHYADPLARERILNGSTPEYRINMGIYSDHLLSSGVHHDKVLMTIQSVKNLVEQKSVFLSNNLKG